MTQEVGAGLMYLRALSVFIILYLLLKGWKVPEQERGLAGVCQCVKHSCCVWKSPGSGAGAQAAGPASCPSPPTTRAVLSIPSKSVRNFECGMSPGHGAVTAPLLRADCAPGELGFGRTCALVSRGAPTPGQSCEPPESLPTKPLPCPR